MSEQAPQTVNQNPTDAMSVSATMRDLRRAEGWVGDAATVSDQTLDDFDAYLAKRPTEAGESTHEQDTLESTDYSKMHNSVLIRKWAEAEDAGDKTIAGDIQDEIMERVANRTDRETDEEKRQVLDSFIARKDALRASRSNIAESTEPNNEDANAEESVTEPGAGDDQSVWDKLAGVPDIESDDAEGIDEATEVLPTSEIDSYDEDAVDPADTAEYLAAGEKSRFQKLRDRWQRGKGRIYGAATRVMNGDFRRNRGEQDGAAESESKARKWTKRIVGGVALIGAGFLAYKVGTEITGGTPKTGAAMDQVADWTGRKANQVAKGAVAAAETTRGARGGNTTALVEAVNTHTNELLKVSGDFPWNRAAAAWGEQDATSRLLSATNKLKSMGYDVQWHGNPNASNTSWISIDGISNTDFVWDKIARVEAGEDIKSLINAAA